MMDVTRVFIHGLDSSSRGTKGTFFQSNPRDDHGRFLRPLQTEDGTARAEPRSEEQPDPRRFELWGPHGCAICVQKRIRTRHSSSSPPPYEHGDFSPYDATPLELPVTLYHGRQDLVVPPEPTRLIAERLFRNMEIHLVDDDHNLHLVFPMLDWDRLLEMG